MAKSREKVQQLGFFDTEVLEPDHDKVQLWAYRHASEIFRAVHSELFGGGWRRNEILPWVAYAGDRKHLIGRAEAFASTTPRPDPRVEGKVLEYVLCRHTGYGDKYQQIVGYADLVLKTQTPMISESDDPGGIGITWREGPLVLIEAKVKLPTVGELMRQLQLYRTAFRGKLVVVSPDDAYADLLREQDVTFIKYEV